MINNKQNEFLRVGVEFVFSRGSQWSFKVDPYLEANSYFVINWLGFNLRIFGFTPSEGNGGGECAALGDVDEWREFQDGGEDVRRGRRGFLPLVRHAQGPQCCRRTLPGAKESAQM